MKIALFGGGHIGQMIASLLTDTGDYQVTVFDSNKTTLKNFKNLGISTELIGETDILGKKMNIKSFDAVINALPHHLTISLAQHALASGCHYFDLTEDVAATNAIIKMAEGAKTAFMPQCGLAPGFIGIAAYDLIKKFEKVNEIKMRVGALPQFPTNSLKYNLTWSIDGLINEYSNPCSAIHNGEVINLLPMEGLEHFSLDGVEYEAFNTSGGLGTLCDTLNDENSGLSHMDYKTVRYPGHCDRMKFLLQDLGLTNDRENLKDILRKSIPHTKQDVVLVFVSVTGTQNGKMMQEIFTRKIYANEESSAIQITTAGGICAAVDLFRQGKLPQSGFIRQEQVDLTEFLNNRFGSVYNN